MDIIVEKFIKDYDRMCNSYEGCVGCELNGTACGSINSLEVVARVVNEWAKEHPAKTYVQDFKEKFPKANESAIKAYCVKDIYGKSRAPELCSSCLQCWSREM